MVIKYDFGIFKKFYCTDKGYKNTWPPIANTQSVSLLFYRFKYNTCLHICNELILRVGK